MHPRAMGVQGVGVGGYIATAIGLGFLSLISSASADWVSRCGAESIEQVSQGAWQTPWRSDVDFANDIIAGVLILDALSESDPPKNDASAAPVSIVDLGVFASFRSTHHAPVFASPQFRLMHVNVRERASPTLR